MSTLRLHGVDDESVIVGRGRPMAGTVECLNIAIEETSGDYMTANLEPAKVRRLRDYLTDWLQDEQTRIADGDDEPPALEAS
ncbi:MAG TPA: hypothetical protein VIQ11_01350 [Mycobacterium sp.]